jgi:hypothetical protein
MRTAFLLTILFVSALLARCPLPIRAEIVDRIVAVVNGRVIAWSAALAEANYQAFRSGQEPVETLDGEALGKIVSRMTDQMLLETERDISPFSPASNGISGRGGSPAGLEDLRKRYPDAEAFRNALRRYKLSEEKLLQRSQREEGILAFVDYHLRPQVRVTPERVEAYYRENFLPQLQREGGTQAPPLSEVSTRIEQILAEAEMNRLLEEWLQQLRSHAQIRTLLESRPAPVSNSK